MNVEQLLQIPEFKNFKLIAGRQENSREITSVNVIDSPDSHTFFRGGEFLLTNTYIMRNDVSILKDITVACSKVGVAAIGLKLGRFIQELPEDYITLANEMNFPVILLPADTPFEAIISRVYAEIVNSQYVRLDYSEKVHNSFTQLVLQGGSTPQILKNLSELLERDVCYYDTYFEHYYHCRSNNRFPFSDAPISLSQALERYPHHLLEVNGINCGFLVILEEQENASRERQEYDKIAVQHAGTVLKLNCQKEISNQQIESKHRDEFVQGLLLDSFSSIEEINARKSIYGWTFDRGLVAVVINCDENTWDHKGYDLDTFLTRKVKQLYPQSMYTKLGAQLVFLVEPEDIPFPQFMTDLRHTVSHGLASIRQEYPLAMHVGIGSYKSSLQEAHLSYREAQTASQIGHRLGQQIACYDELGIYQLLSQIENAECVSEFLNKHIRPLVAYDEVHNSEYLKTLRCLIDNDWNLQKTAEDLYVHYNTIKNRYYKIAEILGEDLRNPNVKINLTISLKLLQLEK